MTTTTKKMTVEEFLTTPPVAIVKIPDPVLFEVAQPVSDLEPWQKISDIMFDLMVKFHGCGLAAPQVGLSYRAFILGTSKTKLTFINPEVLEVGDQKGTSIEGCLSIPGFSTNVERPRKIKVKWTGLDGKETIQTFEGLTSRAFQHEFDHLNGVLIKK